MICKRCGKEIKGKKYCEDLDNYGNVIGYMHVKCAFKGVKNVKDILLDIE